MAVVFSRWWEHVRRWDFIRIFLVGAGSLGGLLLDRPLPWVTALAILVAAGLLLGIPARWFRSTLWGLGAEILLGFLLVFLSPGMGIFPLFCIAGDVGSQDIKTLSMAGLALALGLAAAWGITVGPGHPFPPREFLVLALVLWITMWTNAMGDRKHHQLVQTNEQLRQAGEVARELASATERERITHDLHDGLGHSLTLMILKAQLIEERIVHQDWESLYKDNHELLRVARQSLDGLRTVVEATPKFPSPSVAALTETLKESGIDVTLEWNPRESWPPTLYQDILAILQEAVTNILRHAEARRVWFSLTHGTGWWRLEILDDGCGSTQPEGMGLNGVRRRARIWGGSVHIGSGVTGGLSLVITGTETSHD